MRQRGYILESSPAKLVPFTSEKSIFIGPIEVQLLFLPGHTDGHIVIWLPQSRTLLAGDHIVGFGSAVLDPDGGGNMQQYLESTTRLVNLDPIVAVPAHGHPVVHGAKQLLEQYISHRLARFALARIRLAHTHFDLQ